jgi:gliding motility-associated-like protein
MNKQILSVLFVSLSILGFSQARKSMDSLAGFNYEGALEHASHMKTDKEKKDFLDHAKRTYKISEYKLAPHNSLNIGRNGQAYSSYDPAGANLHPGPNTIMQGPQPTGCTNIDFEGGNTTSWTVAGDFVVTSGGTDPYGGFPKVFPGGTNSLKLNDDNITGKVNFQANASRVIPVSAANNQFQLHFAFCILNFPHPSNAAAVFQVQFFNAANTQLACPTFTCYYANPPGAFFGMPASVVQTSSVTGKNIGNQVYPVTYVNWQTIAMDLSPYNGQNITVKITCNWCLYNYDWGYCYVDADCAAPNFVPTNNPCGPMPQTLTGPIGMQSYTWTPPGGGTAVPTQSMTATVAGVYTLQCTPFTACAATQTYTFAVGGAPPTANFISAPACINGTTSFTSTSLPGGSAISSYTWNFGDGSSVLTGTNATTPTHTYTTGGPKPVKLIVTNLAGCRDSITINVTPVPSPIAQFNFTTACVNSPLQFVDNTNLNGGPPIAGYTWQWNDATPNGNTPTATHIYTTSTPKTVQLVVVNSSGCRDSITKNFNINPAPIVNWTGNNVCYGALTNFVNNTNPNGSNVTTWNWDLNGDMLTDNNQQNPSLIYPASGVYNVGLIAITDLGCSDTLYQIISVYSKPIARFGYTKTCFGDPTQFIDNSYVVGTTGTINQWAWDIDNNINTIEGTLQNAMLTYPSSGPHTANLIVTTNFGCKDTATMTMFVNVTPTAEFVADKTQGCSKLPVRFSNQSHIAYGSITSYSWTLGDHAGSADTTAYHIYPAGTYTVKLQVVSDSGCYAEKTIPAYIHSWPVPVADYTVSPQTTDILEPYVNFTNLTQGSYTNWWWYFGDKPQPDTATMHPVHYYDSDFGSKYLTTLIVKNQYGCYDTAQRLVVIEPNFVIYVPNAFTPNGDGINDIFYAKGYYLDKFEMNIFDRWGELVFTSNDIHKGWDGNVKGKGVVSENTVYVWKITTVDTQKRRKELTGHVTLIK